MALTETPSPQTSADQPPPRRPGSEAIPGYRLLQTLGKGGFGEVWKCEAPGGLLKAIKFVHGGMHALDHDGPAEEELRAIQRVKAIRHPFILSLERVERVGHELVIVLELADTSLADLAAAQRTAGRPGIAREPLLNYLREAAEALDLMNACYDLQHLDIKPQNLFLVSNHVKVGDFGLVNSLAAAGNGDALKLGAITPVYASPEVFQGSLSRHSDQYSLAIVYQELLTGRPPFDGKNARQLLLQHLQGEPDLRPLPEADQPVVARALAKDPQKRFPSCSDFVHALLAGQTEVVSATVPAAPPPGPGARPIGETRRIPTRKTVSTQTLPARPPMLGREAAARCKLRDLVSRCPLGEVWTARAADGSPRLAKVLFGLQSQADEAVARLSALRHPALLPCQVVEHTAGRLVLSTPFTERSLWDCLLEYQSEGLPGIPRGELLDHLGNAAKALDAIYQGHGLQHLALNPRNLLPDGDLLLLADFGLVQLFWLPASQGAAAVRPRYSAPELLAGRVSPACDQYSLALIYHELLTGSLPAAGDAGPYLERLPECDRAVVARALDSDPRKRWENSAVFVGALRAANGESRPAGAASEDQVAGILRTQFGTSLDLSVVRQRLEGFREQWKGKAVSSGVCDIVFHMEAPRSYWQRCTGRQPALEVSIHLAGPEPQAAQSRTEVRVDVRPHQCGREQSAELLRVTAPLLVESVRAHLQVKPGGRREERLLWQHPLRVCALLPDGRTGAAVECHGKDISLNGIGFYLPGELIGPQLVLYLPQTQQTPRAILPARVVRAQGCGDGWYEVGAALLSPCDEAVATSPKR
jgi:serine/threonine protein kinase